MDEDDVLMERAKGGDTVAFDAIVRRHQDRLQRFAIRMAGGDPAKGADVAVGAFLRLWESRQTYRPQGRLGAWLLQTAYRQLIDEARRARPTDDLDKAVDPMEGPQVRIERTAQAQAVRDAVAALPEIHRAVVVLSVYEDLTQSEIAEILEIPAGTVASRKAHALDTLRRRLAAWSEPL